MQYFCIMLRVSVLLLLLFCSKGQALPVVPTVKPGARIVLGSFSI
jgi:hypothetical protein